MSTWIDDGSLQEQIPLEFNEDLEDQNSSDADSFVSASDNTQLEFDDIINERLVNESQLLKLFREAVLHTAGSHSHLEFHVSGLQHYIRHGICCRKISIVHSLLSFTTAIWGVLKAKTSYLKDPYGFMAHFYVVAQYVSPVLAWGFLGSDDKLKIVCEYFKSLILDFIRDLFDFTTCDYSSIESLCDSIVRLAKERSEQLLNSDTCETKLLQAAASFDETLIEAPTTPSKEVQKNEEHV
ncbi:mitoguardin 1-like [Pocillopora verrucosa]|uniref:mitoguardin 1-like n=1 Tax=Pocillopora verrucosa TaxID=203993 RepID=UPI003340F3A6